MTPTSPNRLATSLLLLATAGALGACGGDENTNPSGDGPKILQFVSNAQSVAPGANVTLTWVVQNATSITITAQPGVPLVQGSDTLSGSMVTAPIQARTTFTLEAVDGDGAKATATVIVGLDLSISRFQVMPDTVDRGQPSTLSWATENATRVRITDGGGAPVPGADGLTGMVTVMPASTTMFTLTAEGPGGPKTQTVTLTVRAIPSVVSFTARPGTIGPGDAVELEYQVADATQVVVKTSSGAEVFRTTALSGARTVRPAQSEVYTLEASNEFGTTRATAQVIVNRDRGARISTFTASPEMIGSGGASTLSWVVSASPGGIEIATTTGQMITSSNQLAGTITVRPTMTTTYRLTAHNPEGDATALATVTVSSALPEITSFTAMPNPGPTGGMSTLSWTTMRGTRLRLLRGATEVLDTTVMGTIDMGNYMAPLTVTSTVYTLEVQNTTGTNRQMLTLRAQDRPMLGAFTVRPLAYVGTSTRVTVTWAAGNATTVQLLADGRAVPRFPGTLTGMFTFTATGTVFLELVATNAVATARQGVTIAQVTGEGEPNNSPQTATMLMGNGTGSRASINPIRDRDYYTVIVPAGGKILAQTSDGQGGCALDTIIRLYGPDGMTELGQDDEDGPGSCSEINPTRDVWATNLAAGSYYLAVEEVGNDAMGTYVITVSVTGPMCGNGILESRANERCDDGNTRTGDGCNATCQPEIGGMVMGPPSSNTFLGAINNPGERDTYTVVLSSPGYITAETFAPMRPMCDSDTILFLYDAQMRELDAHEDGATGSDCAFLGVSHHQTGPLPAGTYYIVVGGSGMTPTIAAYSIEITTTAPRCGNGLIESSLGETCDDGNQMSGDGCSSTCRFEGQVEMEANNTPQTANMLTGPAAILAGSLNSTTDVDWFRITVPAGNHLEAFMRVGATSVCPIVPEGRISLFASNGTTQLAVATFASGACARMAPDTTMATRALPAGTYYLRVDEATGMMLGNYILHVNVIAPGCGNGVLEGTEQCDDGAQQSGDGCSATCQFEVQQTFNAPGGMAQVNLPMRGVTRLFRVNLTTPGQAIEVATSNGAGGCPVDTTIELRDASFNRVGIKTAGGPMACAAILYPQDVFATDLAAGAYYLFIGNEGVTGGTAVMQVTVHDPMCGNRVTETRAMETCDDGNTMSNDGCSATCTVETVGTYVLPGAPQTIAGAIIPAGDRDTYQLMVTAPAYIRAETFSPTVMSGQCTSVDTVLTLYAPNGTTVLGSDEDDGVGLCSRIAPPDDAFTKLQPGMYTITVEDNGNNDVINYEILLQGIRADECGNGILEAMAGEQCDDGGTQAGDGCSAACRLESMPVAESEPNGTIGEADATNVSIPGIATVFGGIMPATDEDVYSFTVPAMRTATLVATTYSTMGNPGSCDSDTELYLYNSGGLQRAYDDDNGPVRPDRTFGICSKIDGRTANPGAANLPPGQYFIKVKAGLDGLAIPMYFLDVQLLP